MKLRHNIKSRQNDNTYFIFLVASRQTLFFFVIYVAYFIIYLFKIFNKRQLAHTIILFKLFSIIPVISGNRSYKTM